MATAHLLSLEQLRTRAIVLVVSAVLVLASVLAPIAASAANTTWPQDTDLVMSGSSITLKILAGSNSDSLTVNPTTFTVTVAAGESFTIRYPAPSPGRLANDGGLSECTLVATHNEIIVNGPRTVTFTPNTGFCGAASGGGGLVNTIRVLSPNGGETLQASQQKQVTWQYGGSANHAVTLAFSTDGGATYTQIASIPQPDPGIYFWTVPNLSTTVAKVRVDFVQNGAVVVSDTSDGNFTIVGTVVTPPQQPPDGGITTSTVFIPSITINEDYGLAASASPAPCVSGSLIRTASQSAVYYCGANGKRYVFPNEKVYFSWYPDFSTVITISNEQMASAMLGGNVTHKPGSRMIKIESDPKVYVVSRGGLLRWVPTEDIARRLYGTTWNKSIDDVSVSLFPNHRFGADITSAEVP